MAVCFFEIIRVGRKGICGIRRFGAPHSAFLRSGAPNVVICFRVRFKNLDEMAGMFVQMFELAVYLAIAGAESRLPLAAWWVFSCSVAKGDIFRVFLL